MKAALAFAVALSAASAAVPQFAQEWSAFIVSDLVQNQGTFNGPNDSLCCDINAIDCQVQVQSQGGMTYFSLSRNATSQINGPGQDPYAVSTPWSPILIARSTAPTAEPWFLLVRADPVSRAKSSCYLSFTL